MTSAVAQPNGAFGIAQRSPEGCTGDGWMIEIGHDPDHPNGRNWPPRSGLSPHSSVKSADPARPVRLWIILTRDANPGIKPFRVAKTDLFYVVQTVTKFDLSKRERRTVWVPPEFKNGRRDHYIFRFGVVSAGRA